jgi:hypothetical protein
MAELRDQPVALAGDLVRMDARNSWLIEGAPGEAPIAADRAARFPAVPGVEVTVEVVEPGPAERPGPIARESRSSTVTGSSGWVPPTTRGTARRSCWRSMR